MKTSIKLKTRHGLWYRKYRQRKSPDGYFYWNTTPEAVYTCSKCLTEANKAYNFCPYCGGSMIGGIVDA